MENNQTEKGISKNRQYCLLVVCWQCIRCAIEDVSGRPKEAEPIIMDINDCKG